MLKKYSDNGPCYGPRPSKLKDDQDAAICTINDLIISYWRYNYFTEANGIWKLLDQNQPMPLLKMCKK